MPTTPETWLEELTVNTVTGGSQRDANITQLVNGNILVTWSSFSPNGVASPAGLDIVGQLFDPLGNLVGSEFLVNQNFNAQDESIHSIAALPDGGFLVAYEETDVAVSLRLDRYDASGTHVTSQNTIISDVSTAHSNYFNPQLAASSATSVLILYQVSTSISDLDLVAKIYNPTTNTLGNEFSVINNSGGLNNQVVAVLTNGNYVVASYVNQADDAIVYRIFSPTGSSLTPTLTASGTGTNVFIDKDPAIAALTGGGYVISWTNIDENDTDIQFQIYTSGGSGVGGKKSVDGGSLSDNHTFSAISALGDGGFAIIYDDEDANALKVSRYSDVGTKVGSTYTISSGSNLEEYPSAILLEDGRFAVVWTEYEPTGSGEIRMEILDVRDDDNPTPVYSPNDWQVGTIGDDMIAAVGAVIHGWDGNDQITDSTGNANQIHGDDGDDTIDGGAGVDQQFGGAGNDRITYDAADDLANVLGGADTDTLVILGGSAPVGFDLTAHEFELAEHSFGITGGAQRDTYNTSWQRTDRTLYQDDGSRSETHFDPAGLVDTVQIDDNFDTSGTYVSQTGFYDVGGRWAANFNIDGANDYIYNYFDAADRLDYTTGRFDTGLTFLEDADQGNLNDWTNKYAVNTAAGAADYQYDTYDNGMRSYLDHDQDGVFEYLYQYTFYDASNVATHYFGKYNDGTDFYFDL